MKKLRVIAIEGARVPHRDETGRIEAGRYVGRDGDDKPVAEVVLASPHVLRALHRGDLSIIPDLTDVEGTVQQAPPALTAKES